MGFGKLGTGAYKGMSDAGSGISLLSGQAYAIPNGNWIVKPGPYTFLQYYDPVAMVWRNFDGPFNNPCAIVVGDGMNYRLFNPTGTVVGAVVTNGGTANTAKNGIWAAGSDSVTGVTATAPVGGAAPAGTAQFNCIVGGAVSTVITVTAGGAGYLRPPIVRFDQPAPGGLQATAYSVLTNGVVTSIVVTNQGGGYSKAPKMYIENAPGDTSGADATATCILDAAVDGTLVAVTMADGGAGYNAVPAITIAGLAGAPAATAIMCFTVVTPTTIAGGTNYNNGAQLKYVADKTAGVNTTTNPAYTTGLFNVRDGRQNRTTTAGATGGVVIDGGLSQIDHSNAGVLDFTSNGTVPGATTFSGGAPGGVVDTSMLLPV